MEQGNVIGRNQRTEGEALDGMLAEENLARRQEKNIDKDHLRFKFDKKNSKGNGKKSDSMRIETDDA